MMPGKKTYVCRMAFSGLCAYVPRGARESRPEGLDVLLLKAPAPPEASIEGVTPDLEGSYEAYEVHHPVLRFSLKNLPGQNWVQGEAHGFWLLQGEDVYLFHSEKDGSDPQPLKGKVRLKRKGRLPGSEKPDADDPDQISDVSWLPEMSKALPEAGEIDQRWVRDVNPSLRIAARLRLEKGRLVSWRISDYRREFVVARFIPTHNECQQYVQAVAHWVAMEIKVPVGRSVLIKALTYEVNEERRLLLQPSGGTDLDVSVTNLCCGYSLTERGYGMERPEPDEDFEHLFQLCRDYDEIKQKYLRLPVPVPVKYRFQRQGREGGGVDPLRCTGARFRIVPV